MDNLRYALSTRLGEPCIEIRKRDAQRVATEVLAKLRFNGSRKSPNVDETTIITVLCSSIQDTHAELTGDLIGIVCLVREFSTAAKVL